MFGCQTSLLRCILSESDCRRLVESDGCPGPPPPAFSARLLLFRIASSDPAINEILLFLMTLVFTLDMRTASGFMSKPTALFPCRIDSRRTPPDPINGSNTTSPALQYLEMTRLAISGCILAGYRCMPWVCFCVLTSRNVQSWRILEGCWGGRAARGAALRGVACMGRAPLLCLGILILRAASGSPGRLKQGRTA